MPFETGSIYAKIEFDKSTFAQSARAIRDEARKMAEQVKRDVERYGVKKVIDAQRVGKDFKLIQNEVTDTVKRVKGRFATLRHALTLSTQPFIVALETVKTSARAASVVIRTALTPPLAAMRAAWGGAKILMAEFALFMKTSLAGIRLAWIGLGAVVKRSMKVIRTSIRILTTPFRLFNRILTRSIFTLKNLIFVLAAAAFTRRAKEVETIGTAFSNLTRGVGATSAAMLTKLRAATRGTVSDLELMRTTNNAILLGVVRSQDEFAALANAARRLGRAVGRDAVSALNDLAIGIGRQSRLILDNLGLIVKVSKANEEYARKLGVTVGKLTDAQKRTAFFSATMEAVRRKLKDLGPDVETTADAWDRLGAQLSNTFSAISTSLVGGGLAKTLADFLVNTRRRIVALSVAVESAMGKIFDVVRKTIKKLFSGEIDIGEVMVTFVAETFKTLTILIIAGFTALGPIVITAAKNIFAAAAGAIKAKYTEILTNLEIDALVIFGERYQFETIERGFINLTKKIDELERSGAVAEDTFSGLRDRIEEAQRFAGRFAGDPKQINDMRMTAERVKVIYGEIAGEIAAIEETIRRSAALGEWKTEIESLSKNIRAQQPMVVDSFKSMFTAIKTMLDGPPGEEVKGAAKKVAAETGSDAGFAAAIALKNSLIAELKDIGSIIRGEVDTRKIDTSTLFRFTDRDPLWDFKPLITSRVIQPLADAVNGLERFTRALSLRRPDIVEEIDAQRLRFFVKMLGSGVVKLNDWAVAIKKALTVPKLDPQAFADILKPFNTLRDKLRIEVELIGLDEAAAALKRFDLAMEGLNLTGDQKKVVDDLRASLSRLLSLKVERDEMQTASEDIIQQIEQIGTAADQVSFTQLRKEIDKLTSGMSRLGMNVRETFDKIAVAAIDSFSDRLAELDVEIANVGLDPFEQKINGLRRAFAALEPVLRSDERALEEIRALLEEIRALFDKLEFKELQLKLTIERQEAIKRSVDEISSALTDGILGGILEAYQRGESLSKAWAQIAADVFENSMRRAIERLGDSMSRMLERAFSSMGFGAGAAGFAAGLIGIAGGIISSLESRQTANVDDFSEAINSSEAMRGVVAGPTSVAISKVGESLKQALRTTELLLEQILQSMRQGGTGAAPTGAGIRNSTLPLSGSTIS